MSRLALRCLPAFALLVACSAARRVFYREEDYRGRQGCELCNTTHMTRHGNVLMHFYNTVPATEGNHNPSFVKGPNIVVYEGFGSYELGRAWATAINDGNGNDHQNVHFELSNSNEQLFDVQPHINVCHPDDCTCHCPNMMACAAGPTCGCGYGCGEPACGGDPMGGAACPLLHTGALNFTPSADRFGIATVEVVMIDDGIPEEVCDGPVSPNCQKVACERLPCTHSSVVEFTITVLPVNDMPDFKHTGNLESPEDFEFCATRWAYDITAGAWGEEHGQADGQILTFDITNSNPDLFITQPHLRYVQGDEWADLCYKPAPDQVGTVTLEICLRDNGGTENGGINTRDPCPEVITITIYEQNDPPTFVEGPRRIEVDEDGPRHNLPWATELKPGPASEERSFQQLDRFDVVFVDSADRLLFDEIPNIDVENGFLRFKTAKHANTISGTVKMSVYLWDDPQISKCKMCTALRSLEPHPTIEIVINPVNDPPSFRPHNPPNVALVEDQAEYSLRWAQDICVGGTLPDDCVTSEADLGREAQTLRFTLTLVGDKKFPEPFSRLEMRDDGLLTVALNENVNGNYTVDVVLEDSGEAPNRFLNKTTFVISVEAVNDPPYYTPTSKVFIEVAEDSGPFADPTLLEDLRAGPRDEEQQLLTFDVDVAHPELFAEQPAFTPVWHASGRLHGSLTFLTKPHAYGESSIKYYLYDNGGPSPGNKTETRELALIITPVNDPPTFVIKPTAEFYEGSGTAGEDSYHVLNFVSELSPGPLESADQQISFVLSSSEAIFTKEPTINAYGSLTFGLIPNWFGTVTVKVEARDELKTGAPLSDSLSAEPASFVLTILPVNDAPTFSVNNTQVLLPPCVGDASAGDDFCEHTLANWLTDVSVGPFEKDTQQILAPQTRLVFSERGGETMTANPVVEAALQDGAYNLRVRVRRLAAIPQPEMHIVTLGVQDNGGEAHGGLNARVMNFTITVTEDAAKPTMPPAKISSLLVTSQPYQQRGLLVKGPDFLIVDEHDPGQPSLRINYTSAVLDLLPVVGDGTSAELYPYNKTNAAVLSWPLLKVTSPGTYYLRATVTFPDGSMLQNATEPFVVGATGSVALQPFAGGTPFPDEATLRSQGLVMLFQLDTSAATKNYEKEALAWNLQTWGAAELEDLDHVKVVAYGSAADAAGSVPPTRLRLAGVKIVRTVSYPDNTLLEVTLENAPQFDLGGRDGVLAVALSKQIMTTRTLGAAPHRAAEATQLTTLADPKDTMLVVTDLRYPLWSAAALWVAPAAESTEAEARAATGGLFLAPPSNASAGAAFFVRTAPGLPASGGPLGGGGSNSTAGSCCALCTTAETSLQECCKGCFRQTTHLGDKADAEGMAKLRSMVLSGLGTRPTAGSVGAATPALAERVGDVVLSARDTIVVNLRVDDGDRYSIYVADPAAFAMSRGVTPEVVGAGLHVLPEGLRAVEAETAESSGRHKAALALGIIFMLAALVSFPFTLFPLSELGLFAVMYTTTCQPAQSYRNHYDAVEWLRGPFESGAAGFVIVAFVVIHCVASLLTKRHLLFPTVSASVGCFFFPFALLSTTSPNPSWLQPVLVTVCVGVCALYLYWCATLHRTTDARRPLWEKFADEDGADGRTRTSPASLVRRLTKLAGGYPRPHSHSDAHSSEVEAYSERVQRNLAFLNAVALDKMWHHVVDMLRVLVVAVSLSYRSSSISSVKWQLFAALVALAAHILVMALLRPVLSESPLIFGVRALVSLLQAVGVACLLFPILGKTGDTAEAEKGTAWASSEAYAPLLLTALFLSTGVLLLHVWAWWRGRELLRRQEIQDEVPQEKYLDSEGSSRGSPGEAAYPGYPVGAPSPNPIAAVFPSKQPHPVGASPGDQCPTCHSLLEDGALYCHSCGRDTVQLES